MLFKIKEPIWKTRSVGLNEDRLEEENFVQILYKNKSGEKLYPSTYRMSKERVLSFPLQILREIRLRIVPIIELELYYGTDTQGVHKDRTAVV